MTSPFTDTTQGKLSIVCNKVFDSLQGNMLSFTPTVQDVFYGDQQQIPRTPAICVEPDGKKRTIDGVPRRSANEFSLYVLLYVSAVTDSQSNARQALDLAEQVEDFLHKDPTLGGLLVHSFCSELEPGYRQRKDTLFRACRIKFEGINKTVLGM